MRSKILGMCLLVWSTVSTAAVACPVGNDDGVVRPIKPVVGRVSLTASELIARAGRLEASASAREAQARALEREAEALMGRARVLQNQAGLVNVSDRVSILAIADELSLRAAQDRARAAEERTRAESFRMEAETLRRRAIALVRGGEGGGQGWRKRLPPARSGPRASEQGVTL